MRCFRRAFKAMGSPCELQLYARSEQEAAHRIRLVLDDVARLESRYSRYRDDSFLSEINRIAAGGGCISVDDETSGLLDYAASCHRQSDGLFDVTSGILRRAWRFDRGELPDPAQLGRIGIRDPRRPAALLCTVPLLEGGIASSGDYERCIELDGVRYGHLLNPRTGWPVRRMASVSVIGDLCVVAGSASTIAMLKEDAGPGWLREMGLPHLWVDVHGALGGPLASSS